MSETDIKEYGTCASDKDRKCTSDCVAFKIVDYEVSEFAAGSSVPGSYKRPYCCKDKFYIE